MILDTPEAIARYRLLTLKSALALEVIDDEVMEAEDLLLSARKELKLDD